MQEGEGGHVSTAVVALQHPLQQPDGYLLRLLEQCVESKLLVIRRRDFVRPVIRSHIVRGLRKLLVQRHHREGNARHGNQHEKRGVTRRSWLTRCDVPKVCAFLNMCGAGGTSAAPPCEARLTESLCEHQQHTDGTWCGAMAVARRTGTGAGSAESTTSTR